MVLIQSILIKADPYFYDYYNNYINKENNCESDKFIINLLMCKNKLLTFKFINNLKFLESLNKENPYELNVYNCIKNNVTEKCSICVNNCHNKTILSCLHSFCYKCINEYNNFNKKTVNNKTKNNKNIQEYKDKHIKCPLCNKVSYNKSLSILFNEYTYDNIDLSYLNCFTRLIQSYISSNDKYDKEFIYKYLGYKTYYILDTINKNKSPLNITKKSTKQYNIIISYSNNWIQYIDNIINKNPKNNSENSIITETKINFMYYNTFLVNFINYFNEYIDKLLLKKIKFTFFFIEPRTLQLNNEL